MLLEAVPKLTVLEIDPTSSELLRAKYGDRAEVVEGMLHHVPAKELQDAIFAEAARVLRPGGTYFGSDGQLNLRFRLLHLGDTMNVVDAATFPARLEKAGFEQVKIQHHPKELLIFEAVKPG